MMPPRHDAYKLVLPLPTDLQNRRMLSRILAVNQLSATTGASDLSHATSIQHHLHVS